MPDRPTYHRPAAAAASTRAYESDRQPDKNFYSSARWRRLRIGYLRAHPLCEACDRSGKTTQAEHVHHKRARKLAPQLAFSPANLEALCIPCHNAQAER